MSLPILACFTVFIFLVSVEAGTIGFTAGLDADQTIYAGETVVFNKVFTNKGEGYNNETGFFTCPLDGEYVFQFHALSDEKNEFWIELFLNDVYQISAYARQRGDYDAAGNSIILSLEQGDTVYIKTRREARFFGRPDQVYATFTGYLISPGGYVHDK